MSETVRDALFVVVLFAANVIQAITGFAGTVLAMPFSMLLLGTDTAKVVLNITTLLACLWLGVQHHAHIRWRILAEMVGLMAIGMAAGVALYVVLPLDPLQKAYGVFIIVIALKNLIWPSHAEPPHWLLVIIVLLAGVIHGMFISGGALLVIYAAVRLKDKNEFRATMACVWVALNSVLAVQQGVSGVMTPHALMLTAVSIPPLIVAIAIGNHLQKQVSQQAFLKLTYVLLVISGASIVL
ncbi:sulfite exporter TauE/SafE family protein [Bifidobacterium imperatoris]|uniref:Probable membrane transporter protein n=1 Tax=Bifidobacterium imperatoris TaxID=2020965 RepID=A0A2N5ISV6_9BIFI|nr:sulfite exporter TauE/SafE family protein [Bifidobacterium imperatoris]PLS25048.1 sulfite exporter TauE/SafE [Bifidobacterium imperatoris]QSY58678.1 sulfite exporter TauE/SafE family protein [Bifidobacterium imperatoris]